MTGEYQPNLRAEVDRIVAEVRARGGAVVWNSVLREWMLPTTEANKFLGMGPSYLRDRRYDGGGPSPYTWPPTANAVTGRKHYLVIELAGYLHVIGALEKKVA
jgi:hypothetical protein